MDDTPPLLPSPLELPSGGKVWFKDPESLRGSDYKRLRRAAVLFEEDPSKPYEVGAALLVERWEIPDLPNLPLPGDPDGLDGKVTDLLHWRDLLVLERAMQPAILEVRGIKRGPADPPGQPSGG